jgi:hypothetical protein
VVIRLLLLLGTISFGQKSYARSDSLFLFLSEIFPLVPGADLVPFWTLSVLNVYRKWKQITVNMEETRKQRPALPKP